MLSVTIATLFDIVGLIVLTARRYNNREASLLQRDDCHFSCEKNSEISKVSELNFCENIPKIVICEESCTLGLFNMNVGKFFKRRLQWLKY